jgi:hypothetical protein
MNATVSVVIAGISVFLLSSIYYIALTPVEVRALGPAAPQRGGRPAVSARQSCSVSSCGQDFRWCC